MCVSLSSTCHISRTIDFLFHPSPDLYYFLLLHLFYYNNLDLHASIQVLYISGHENKKKQKKQLPYCLRHNLGCFSDIYSLDSHQLLDCLHVLLMLRPTRFCFLLFFGSSSLFFIFFFLFYVLLFLYEFGQRTVNISKLTEQNKKEN